jgi:outer membrane protein assembly factor BamB
MDPTQRTQILLGLLAALFVLGLPRAAAAQPPAEWENEPVLPGIADRQRQARLSDMIRATRALIEKKQWREAVATLQRLLVEPVGMLVPARWKDVGDGHVATHWLSPHAEATALLAMLPPEALADFRRQHEAAAVEPLRQARATGDAVLLARLPLQFPHTAAGREALELLAEQHTAAGRHLAAALCLDRVAGQSPVKRQARWLVQAAAAYRRAGDKASADRLVKRLYEVIVNDPTALKDAEVELERIPIPAVAWALFRGNAARNGHGPVAAGQVKAVQWARPVLLDKGAFDEEETGKETKQWLDRALQQGKRPLLPGAAPLAVGDVAIFRTHRTVTAVALRDFHNKSDDSPVKAGDILLKSVEQKGSLVNLLDDGRQFPEVTAWQQYYDKAGASGFVLENSLTGTLTADRQFFYVIDDLAMPPPPQMFQPVNWKARSGLLRQMVEQNTLQAFAVRDGRLVWQLHGEFDVRQRFNRTHWLGAPLPLGGVLYVLNESHDGKLWLVCLESATGKVLSDQRLATTQERFLYDPNRRTQASHLAYADGVLLCPTNAGTLLAVDLATQTLLWAYTYRPVRETDPAELKLSRSAWHGSAPILHDGRVVYAGPDDARLHCLELRDGKPLWRVKQSDDLFVAGVLGERVVLVGANHCRALRLKDGSELWKVVIDEPTGLGVLGADGLLMQPVRGKAAALWAIDTAKGQVVARQPQPEALGNLLRHGGQLLSQSPTRVSAYPLAK